MRQLELILVGDEIVIQIPKPRDGVDGIRGPEGPRGFRGFAGLDGAKGDKGDQGVPRSCRPSR